MSERHAVFVIGSGVKLPVTVHLNPRCLGNWRDARVVELRFDVVAEDHARGHATVRREYRHQRPCGRCFTHLPRWWAYDYLLEEV